jgi:rhodanese-related sulfurtransferase
MSISTTDLLTPIPGATIINAGKHAGKHEILGAVRYVPQDLLAATHLALPIAHDSPVILYAEHGRDQTLDDVAAKLRAEGFTDVQIWDGTLEEYERAGGATQVPSTEQMIPPTMPDESQLPR